MVSAGCLIHWPFIPIRPTSREEGVCDFCPLSPYMQRLMGGRGREETIALGDLC